MDRLVREKMPNFPLGNKPIRLAMLGMVEGNGHPYSWSIMINGRYDSDALAACPYPVIDAYIRKQPPETLGIAGAEVTHVWTDDPADAEKVAQVADIPNIAARAEDVIGEVDAVIIATDKGFEHVERTRPFIEAGLPVFVDKPLCDNREDLATFTKWAADGHPIQSSSSMRFAKEFMPYHGATHEFGAMRHIFMTMAKKWETYGIHALESVYPILGPGFVSVRNIGSFEHNVVELKHRSGAEVTLVVAADLGGGAGLLTLAGTQGGVQVRPQDSYSSFKKQLDLFVHFLRTGEAPFDFAQTRELMKIIIAGIESREQGGREIMLSEFED